MGLIGQILSKKCQCPSCEMMVYTITALQAQNSQLHDRLLAVTKPEALRELTARDVATAPAGGELGEPTLPVEEITERPGTQVGE